MVDKFFESVTSGLPSEIVGFILEILIVVVLYNIFIRRRLRGLRKLGYSQLMLTISEVSHTLSMSCFSTFSVVSTRESEMLVKKILEVSADLSGKTRASSEPINPEDENNLGESLKKMVEHADDGRKSLRKDILIMINSSLRFPLLKISTIHDAFEDAFLSILRIADNSANSHRKEYLSIVKSAAKAKKALGKIPRKDLTDDAANARDYCVRVLSLIKPDSVKLSETLPYDTRRALRREAPQPDSN